MKANPHEDKKPLIKEQYVVHRQSIETLAFQFQVPHGTINSWVAREKWTDERDKLYKLTQEHLESVRWLTNPDTEETAIIEGNARVALEIQGLHLARIKHDLLADKPVTDISDVVQKYATALDKLNNTLIKAKNGGVDKKQVTHIHSVDVDKALEVSLKAYNEGKLISVNEAAKVVEKMEKEQKDAK